MFKFTKSFKKLYWFASIALFLGILSIYLPQKIASAQGGLVADTPIVESEHPYANNEDTTWVINNDSGLSALRLHFSRIELEEGVDKIEIRDMNDTFIQKIDASAPDGLWSDVVPGELAKVILKSDGSGRFWGFAIEQIETLDHATFGYSDHPYPNNSNEMKTFLNSASNPSGTRLHFDRIEMEQDVDYIIITDADDNPYQWITGNYPNGFTSKAVPDSIIKVHLVSDGSGQAWGYNVDTIETASPDSPDTEPTFPTTLAESDHPYSTITQVWTITNTNVNAVSSKVHFSRIDLTRDDILQVLDQNDTVIQTFGENTHLTDVWSDYVPGRVVKFRIIDSGIYQDWGFRVNKIVDSIPNPGLAQSDHPYAAGTDQVWTVINPNVNAVSSKVHFSQIDLTRDDILQVLDQNDTVIQTFGENTHLTDVWSDYVPGRVVKFRIIDSGIYQDWGFRVNKIVDSVPDPGLAQSDHPYAGGTDQVWTVINPNVNAISSTVQFSRIDLTRDDILQVLDQNDTVIQTFGENTHLTDVWSDYVPGRVVKFRIIDSGIYQDWGFRVNKIHPTSSEPVPRAYASGVYVTVLYPGVIYLNDIQVTNAQKPGEYKVLLPGQGDHIIRIEYLEYTQEIHVSVDAESNMRINHGLLGMHTTVDAAIGDTLVYTDAQTNTTEISIPVGGVTEETKLVFTPLTMPEFPGPAGFSFANHAFTLNAYRNGVMQIAPVFQNPLTIKIQYSDSDVVDLNEDTLELRYWDGTAWSNDGIALVEHNTTENYVIFSIAHLSEFALFGQVNLATISKSVTPQGKINYGDELTYTLVISGSPGAQVALYDPLEGTTFSHFLMQPTGITQVNNVITGSLTITPTNQMTVSFVAQVKIPGTLGWTVTTTNRACVFSFGGTLGGCVWSNEVTNPAFHPYNIYLPVVLRER